MGTITLPNFRITADVHMNTSLKDGGVAIDWAGLTGIKAWVYSDPQKALAGRVDVTIDSEDSTVLACTYPASRPQYLGVNRLIIQASYMGSVKTFDKPVFNFVARTADQAGEQLVIDDPEVDVTIEVSDVSSSVLDAAIAAALKAASDANAAAKAAEDAAALVPYEILRGCIAATANANTAAEHAAPYIGENGHWWIWDQASLKYVDSGKVAKGDTPGWDDFSPEDKEAMANEAAEYLAENNIEPEDLQLSEDNKIQLADRAYNAQQPDGMGYVILRKDASFAEQVTEINTIYEIRNHFELNEASVSIPAGCVLRFNGGDLANGTLIYNNTEIQGNPIINCACTGGLRNPVVTPQMYGARGDGVTDDTAAIRNAADSNLCIFFPAGDYIINDPILMRSGMTIFGVGKESKIVNPAVDGFNKVCVSSGNLTIGNNTGSFLGLPSYACTIASDRYSVLVSDTSPFKVGDLVFINKDETGQGTKNPARYWNAKVVEIEENTSLKLDYYIDNDDLLGVNCLIRDLAVLPASGDRITENICIHDLSLINSRDAGSGMYVFALASYGASIYNIWSHGNTIIGSNYLINATLRNITAEFDGGFLDIPEINQNVEVCDCRATRFGERQNIIGFTFLQGYRAYIHDNFIDFGGNGKISVAQHIRPVIQNNVFINLKISSGRPIELSKFGQSILRGNTIKSPQTSAIVHHVTGAEGDIIQDNYIENPNVDRWLEGFTTLNYNKNIIKGNITRRTTTSDAYYSALPNTILATNMGKYSPSGTRNIEAGATWTPLNDTTSFAVARAFRVLLMLQKGNYAITLTNSNGATTSFTLQNGTWIEIFFFAASNYANCRRDGDLAGSVRQAWNSSGALTKVDVINNDAETRQAYVFIANPVIE